VYVTDLPESFNAWNIQDLYRQRADVENVFDELKNQWGFSGFCAKARATTELAARLTLLVYKPVGALRALHRAAETHPKPRRGGDGSY